MKKLSTSLVTALAVIVSLTLPACNKTGQHLPDDIDKLCRIDTITVDGQQIKVSYNAAGDPASMLPVPPIIIHGPAFNNIYFQYDKYDRLIAYLNFYSTNSFPDFSQKFSYPEPRVIIDTIFNIDVTGPPSVVRYDLDEKGRTIKTTTLAPLPRTSFTTSYDKNGNWIRTDADYDDKINVYRTSKTWQLLFQDYSRNNPIPDLIPAYNAAGLPLHYQATAANSHPHLFFYYEFFSLSLSYTCDIPGKHP